ncbi:MAG: response regulator transcription factor [Myxococcales bacterium]|nr:response regulator transcription factor [Myxococcales bacterium]
MTGEPGRPASEIRVAVADDHALFRAGLARLLEVEPDLTVVGDAADGRSAMTMFLRERPDVLVLDIMMPEKDGLDVIKELLVSHPRARILVLSAHDDLDHASRVMRAGATGFVSKSAAPPELIVAIRAVAAGRTYLPDGLAEAIEDASGSRLTDREFQVMIRIATGMRNREIANELSISQKTVDTHRANVLKKLGLKTNADLARYAVSRGYLAA